MHTNISGIMLFQSKLMYYVPIKKSSKLLNYCKQIRKNQLTNLRLINLLDLKKNQIIQDKQVITKPMLDDRNFLKL